MRSLRFYMLLGILFFTSVQIYAQPANLSIKPLDNLFLNNIIHLESGLNCKVFTKKVDFDKTFGFAKTETSTIRVPNFDSEQVIMIALPSDNHDAILSYINAIRAGTVIEVYCKVQKKNYPLTYTAEHIAVASVPLIKGVTTYNFYEGRKLVRSVKLK